MDLNRFVSDVFPKGYKPKHDELYDAVVTKLGGPAVFHGMYPVSLTEIRNALKDEGLNSIPLSRWDRCAGFTERNTQPPKYVKNYTSPFQQLLSEHGLDSLSVSECVCILKQAAIIATRKYMDTENELIEEILRIDHEYNDTDAIQQMLTCNKDFDDIIRKYDALPNVRWTARFHGHTEMDVKLCRENIADADYNPLWTEAVLIRNGREVASSYPDDTLLKTWSLSYGKKTYILHVI